MIVAFLAVKESDYFSSVAAYFRVILRSKIIEYIWVVEVKPASLLLVVMLVKIEVDLIVQHPLSAQLC